MGGALNLSDVSFDISGLDLEQARKVLIELENEGFKGVWLTENCLTDAFVEVAAIFNSTTRIRFGTMVAGISARSPMITSLAALSLSNLSGGRFVLGLGTQTKNSVEYWYGKSFVKPLSQMREFVQIARRLLAGEKVTYDGKHFAVRDLELPRCPHSVKIFIAAIGPKMIQLAGQEANGVMGTSWTPRYIQNTVIPNLKIGAKRSGRSLDDIEILCSYECFPTSESITYEAMRPHIVSLATVPLFEPIFGETGYEDEYKSINVAMKTGDVQLALSKISTEIVSDFEIIGNESQIKGRIAELKRAGLTEVVLHPYLGNMFYEHYPDQFSFDITKFNSTPVYGESDSYTNLIQILV
jgi:alkanesulfonate monooxygenase SsuD/methylene tetrahydromethanopterin reductase-like flavin-dependent oxidoreductase (luciferase family)